MKAFRKKLQEFVYSFSTEDRYADYDENNSEGVMNRGESGNESQIQLADFVDGSNPSGNDGISETLLAWRHIENWANEYNPDLLATLSDPCTRHDISNAESDLRVTFPASVRASLRLHDGQEDLESLTGTCGLIFGLQLMSLDQVVQMAKTWRNVADNLELKLKNARLSISKQQQEINGTSVNLPGQKQKGYGKVDNEDYKSRDSNLEKNISQNYKRQFKMPDIPVQNSVPPLAIKPVYANYGWIPLVTDNAGNHIGVDLAPGPKGKYGQVILFGREFDTKFVVANNWGDFLLSFANDLVLGNWLLVNEGTNDQFAGEGDLVFRDKQNNGQIRDYFEILVGRSRVKWNSFKEKSLPQKPVEKATSSNAPKAEQQNTEILLSGEDRNPNSSISESNTAKEDVEATNQESKTSGSTTIDENIEVQHDPAEEIPTEIAVEDASSEPTEHADAKTDVSSNGDSNDKSENSENGPSSNKMQAETSSTITKPGSVDELKDDFENVAL